MGIIARQGIAASIVGFIGVGIGAFSRLFLYTKFLTVSEIGILETIIKLGMLMIPFFIIGAPQVIIKFYHRFKNEENDSGLIYTYNMLLGVILIPISSCIYILNKDYIFSLYAESPELSKYYILPLVVAISFGLFNYLRSISIVNLRLVVPSIFTGVLDRIIIVILLLLYGYFHLINTDQFIYLNIILFFCIPFILMIFYVYRIIKPKLKKTNVKGALSILKVTSGYNSYLVFGTLSGVVISAIDVNMISGKLGTELAGIYTIAFFMGTVIDIPRRSLTNIMQPILNTAIIENNTQKLKILYQKSSVNQFLVGAFIFLIIWLNINEIFTIIPNGDKFIGGKLVVLFIGLSKLFDMLMGVNKQIIELSDYYKFNLLNDLFLSILIIVFNLIFISLDSPIFGGINGVAFASLLAVILSNLFSFTIVSFKEKIQPITTAHLKIIFLITITFFSLNYLQIDNSFVAIFVKTFLSSLFFIIFSLFFNISDDFKSIFYSIIKKVKK